MQVLDHPVPVALFIEGHAGVDIRHAEPEGVVEENRELPRGGRHGFALPMRRRQPPIEGAEGDLRAAHVDRGDPHRRVFEPRADRRDDRRALVPLRGKV